MTGTSAANVDEPLPTARQMRKIVTAAYVGQALEWYDFFLFGSTAALVFAPLFFPGHDPALSTLGAFLSFAVGFIGRPLGAILFGQIGDRHGRRVALIVSVVLMGLSTALIGLLPTYAVAGIFAPILLTLLRLAQGVSVGGEWGGAMLLAMENADPKRRGFFASLVQLGLPTGTLLSSGAITLFTLMPHGQFMTWGWRMPFLVSIILVALALWLRWRVEETPVFRKLVEDGKVERTPIVKAFRAPGRLVVGISLYLGSTVWFYVITTFMLNYVTRVRDLPASVILNAMTIGSVVQLGGLWAAGKLSTRIGSARTIAVGYLFILVLAFPLFQVVTIGSTILITVMYVIALTTTTITIGPLGHALAQLFPSQLHYSGLSLSVGITYVLGGFAPALFVWVGDRSGNASWAPPSLLLVFALSGLAGTFVVGRIARTERKRRHQDGRVPAVPFAGTDERDVVDGEAPSPAP